jgi:hypothetical protein
MDYDIFFIPSGEENPVIFQEYDMEPLEFQRPLPPRQKFSQKKSKSDAKKRRKSPGAPMTPINIRATKNIVKNYGNAIASFAVSELAVPYLGTHLANEGLDLQGFQ